MTVEEVLRQSGFTDDQIKGLDQRAITAFGGVLATSVAAKEAAELAQRSNADFYENKIVPSLTAWDEEKARYENERARVAAEAAFYRTQAEEARKSGFIPTEAPGFQPRDGQGRYVPGVQGATPGSPTFDVQQVYQRAGDAVGVLTDIQWEHQRLFGQPMPISPTELIRQADQVKLDPKTYAARTFNWDSRRQEIEKQKQEEHDSKIRLEAEQASDRRWSERVGSNPDVRRPSETRYSDVARAVKSGSLPDPLSLNEVERRRATATMIRADISGRNDAA